MRLAALAAAALVAVPVCPLAQDPGEATPAPKADAGPSAPPKADQAPRAGTGPDAQPAPKANATPKPGTASKPPPAAARDLARALLTEDQWSKVLDSYASSLSSQVSQALLSSGEKVPEDLRGTLRAELGKALPYQQTVQAQAEALSKELTADELKRTAQFYSSPLGRKVLEKLPEAQASVAQQLQGRLATAVPEIVNRVAPKAMSGSPHGGGASGGPAQGRRPPPAGSTTQ
jgi:hypothetical protein